MITTEIMEEILGDVLNFPKGSGQAMVLSRRDCYVLEKNVPNAEMVKNILHFGARKTDSHLEYAIEREKVTVFLKFHPDTSEEED